METTAKTETIQAKTVFRYLIHPGGGDVEKAVYSVSSGITLQRVLTPEHYLQHVVCYLGTNFGQFDGNVQS